MRMLELFAGMPFHAFFGIALMMATQPMVGTYTHPPASARHRRAGRPGGGGRHRLGVERDPLVVVLVALLFQWRRSEDREARREDRAADRDGDKELEAYNAYLASLAARGR
ncbi:Cytochrome c oxidase assembly protein OS=Streptomyces alboniger OX=132473 GN=CP975_01645 PE=4 SV=1 [Streptomyces alboniger]